MARDLNACSVAAKEAETVTTNSVVESREGKAAHKPFAFSTAAILQNPFSQLSLLKIERVSPWTWRLRRGED